MRDLTSNTTISELAIEGNPSDMPPIEVIAFDIDVVIWFNFEAGERGCHTRRNGDPGWPEVPPAIYINRVALVNETTFACGDVGDADFVSKTYPASFDITDLISESVIAGLEDDILEERHSDGEFDASARYEHEFECA
jgi:hypothetical protein